jgi:hypothetical protein
MVDATFESYDDKWEDNNKMCPEMEYEGVK